MAMESESRNAKNKSEQGVVSASSITMQNHGFASQPMGVQQKNRNCQISVSEREGLAPPGLQRKTMVLRCRMGGASPSWRATQNHGFASLQRQRDFASLARRG